ncbi:MAG TPA: hypothetical protein VFK40_07235 [Nitrososphaeraceae archaeon]|nr:hypothetical protein [Nitrososphaeraceae archaeon]
MNRNNMKKLSKVITYPPNYKEIISINKDSKDSTLSLSKIEMERDIIDVVLPYKNYYFNEYNKLF